VWIRPTGCSARAAVLKQSNVKRYGGELVGRPKSNGVYAKLSATYYDDDAILEAGPHAELLWVRYLAFTALLPTDGYVTDRQMKVRVGRGLRDVPGRLRSLVEVGLLVAVDDGYVSRSWQKWNRSADDIGRYLAKDRERKARKHGGEGPNSARNGTGFQSDSSDQSKAKQSKSIEAKASSSEVADATLRPDVISLLNLLDEEIRKNGGKVPSRTKKNADAARLMLDRDNIPAADVAGAIRWSQADEFWRSNILSMSKLREKYDQLRLAAQRKPPAAKVGPSLPVAPKFKGPCAHRFVGGFCAECSERET
jgi:hypothetical protein